MSLGSLPVRFTSETLPCLAEVMEQENYFTLLYHSLASFSCSVRGKNARFHQVSVCCRYSMYSNMAYGLIYIYIHIIYKPTVYVCWLLLGIRPKLIIWLRAGMVHFFRQVSVYCRYARQNVPERNVWQKTATVCVPPPAKRMSFVVWKAHLADSQPWSQVSCRGWPFTQPSGFRSNASNGSKIIRYKKCLAYQESSDQMDQMAARTHSPHHT